jgi:hypothetical protein
MQLRSGVLNAPSKQDAGPVRIGSDADYQALPSGAQYMAPDGKMRVKR